MPYLPNKPIREEHLHDTQFAIHIARATLERAVHLSLEVSTDFRRSLPLFRECMKLPHQCAYKDIRSQVCRENWASLHLAFIQPTLG